MQWAVLVCLGFSVFAANADGLSSKDRRQMTNGDGVNWIATYAMQRQKIRSWRIAGCMLANLS
jgi:hypothetical protein